MKHFVTAVLRRSLPQRIKRGLVNLGFNLDRGQFQQLPTGFLFAPDIRLGLEALSARRFSPEVILDINAFEGNWSSWFERFGLGQASS